MRSALPSVAVIVPTYNRASTLRLCLRALATQDYPGPHVVIVVDDGSTDETPEIIAAFREVVYLRQANRGPAAARNRGVAEASPRGRAGVNAEIIAFTDDDCLPPPDWLSRLSDGYQRHPEIVGAGGYLAAPAELLRHNRLAQYERSVGRDEYGAGDQEVLGGFDCPAGGTNNMSYRREVLLQAGGFDETFPFAAGEDADLKLRICQGGARLLYIPVGVTHLQPYTHEAFRRQQLVRGRGVIHFERKHRGHPPSMWRVLLRLAKRLAQLPVELVVGPSRHLVLIRFQARWYDGIGQLQELHRLRTESRTGTGDG